MSEIITFPLPDGADYVIPDIGDENWGQNVTDFLVAIPAGVPPRSGTFALTGDLSFGPTFGLISQYYKSAVVNPASAGLLRLAKTDTLDWRNNANSGNLALGINGSNQLTFNGNVIPDASSVVTSITGTGAQVIASSPTGAVTLSLPQDIALTSSPTFAGLILDAHPSSASLIFVDHAGTHNVSLNSPISVGTTFNLFLPDTQGATDTFIRNDGSGTLSFVKPVISITGTSNEIIASASNGAVTLSTPQAIATTSTPTFSTITLTGLSSVNLPLNGAVTSANAFSVSSSSILTLGGVPSVITSSDFQIGAGHSLLLTDSTTNKITISTPSSVTPYTLLMPSTQSSGTQFLQNNGSGTLSWASPSGSGTVNSGTSTHLAYYATSTAAVSDANGATVSGAYTFSGIHTHSASIAMGANKITGLANGTASTDAAAFGQIYYGFQALVFATGTTQTSLTSGSFTTTVVTGSITPTSASHRVRITANFTSICPVAAGVALYQLYRNGTTALSAGSGMAQQNAAVAEGNQISIVWVDSPATTSATSYTVFGQNSNGAGSITVGNGRDWVVTLEEIV